MKLLILILTLVTSAVALAQYNPRGNPEVRRSEVNQIMKQSWVSLQELESLRLNLPPEITTEKVKATYNSLVDLAAIYSEKFSPCQGELVIQRRHQTRQVRVLTTDEYQDNFEKIALACRQEGVVSGPLLTVEDSKWMISLIELTKYGDYKILTEHAIEVQ